MELPLSTALYPRRVQISSTFAAQARIMQEDDLFVKYDYINGEYDLLLRCYCVPLCPVWDFRILPAYRLARK
jgi:hypothetical protein